PAEDNANNRANPAARARHTNRRRPHRSRTARIRLARDRPRNRRRQSRRCAHKLTTSNVKQLEYKMETPMNQNLKLHPEALETARTPVAQIANLLYRRLLTCAIRKPPTPRILPSPGRARSPQRAAVAPIRPR